MDVLVIQPKRMYGVVFGRPSFLGLLQLHPQKCNALIQKDSNLVDSASSIRLSQRLSHACLSINKSIRETANGSLYQL
jgi:hypothetical protein